MAELGSEHPAGWLQPADEGELASVHEALQRLARPRLTGSAGAAKVESYLKGEFERLGYEVQELPFSFSVLPGRFGVPAAGLVFLVCGVASAALAGLHQGAAALAIFGLGAVLIGLGAYLGRRAIARLPWARLQTSNWLVARPGARPRYLLAAHRDSKSQPVPLFLRAAAIALGAVAALALLGLGIASVVVPAAWPLGVAAWVIGFASAAAGIVFVLSVVGNDSPGALDNASGMAALLGVASRERDSADVGFLVTDGEELGLAGASAVCRQLPPVFGVINLDGLDDAGDFLVMERHGLPRRGLAPHLVAALLTAAEGLDVRAQRRALPLGVLVDHVPLVEAGLSAVTLMRGGRESLRRVHRPEDDAGHLTGEGITQAVALLSGALAVLRRDSAA